MSDIFDLPSFSVGFFLAAVLAVLAFSCQGKERMTAYCECRQACASDDAKVEDDGQCWCPKGGSHGNQ